MKLEETYAYLKERYSITHSFSTFKHNAIKKGLDKDKDYLKLIASVLFSMGYYREGVVEIATDIHETYCGELDGLETHIEELECEKEELEQSLNKAKKSAQKWSEANVESMYKIQSKNKLIRELRAKKDVARNKESERKVKGLEKENKEYFEDCVRLTQEKKELEKELSIAKACVYDWKKVAIKRRKTIDAKRTELGKALREIEKLKEKNMFYKSSVAQWRKDNLELEKELNSLKHKTLFQTLRTYFKNKKS